MIKGVEEVRWFHSIEIGEGVYTPGLKTPELLKMESAYIFKYPVEGKTVLDVGAWDGFYSFEAERLGAKRVLATDYHCWGGPAWGNKDGFDTAYALRGSQVESLEIDAMDIAPENVGQFDVVLFLGVLYHLRHPFLGLEKMAAVCLEHLVVETMIDLYTLDRPAGAFYPGRECQNDPTNWWGLNPPAVVAMLRVLGFEQVEFLLHPTSNPEVSDSMRGIFHAFRSAPGQAG